MAMSKAQKLAKAKYQQEKRSLIAAEVSKAKGEEYRAKAMNLGISLSSLIQRGIESYTANCAGGEFATSSANSKDRLTEDERQLLDAFNQFPSDVRKHFLKGFRLINQLIEDQEQSRQEILKRLLDKLESERQNQAAPMDAQDTKGGD